MHLFPSLATRNLQPELMDDPALPSDQHDHAMRGLTRIHQCSGLVNRFWKPILNHLQSRQNNVSSALRIMDVGCGDGYLIRRIGAKAEAAGYQVELVGIDISETALRLAKEKASASQIRITTKQLNIIEEDLPPADFVINSLFLHHFDSAQVVQVLAKFKAATKQRLIVEDLRRTSFGYVLGYVAGHALTRSPIVHYDALRSVEGAFTIQEINKLVTEAKIEGHTISRRWPQRMVIGWSPSATPSS